MRLTHDKVGLPECPFLERWILDFGRFSIRLHHWLGSDDPRHFHDHDWWFVSLILWGSYLNIHPDGVEHRTVGCADFYPAEYQHSVQLVSRTCWSLLITGPPVRRYGYWVNGKFRKRNKYYFEHGHHPCNQPEYHT